MREHFTDGKWSHSYIWNWWQSQEQTSHTLAPSSVLHSLVHTSHRVGWGNRKYQPVIQNASLPLPPSKHTVLQHPGPSITALDKPWIRILEKQLGFKQSAHRTLHSIPECLENSNSEWKGMISTVTSGMVTFSMTLNSARAQEQFRIRDDEQGEQIWWEQAGRVNMT